MKEVLQLTNDIQDVPRLGEWVEHIGELWELPMPKVFNLNLALEEAVVNVMNYAYPGQQGMPVVITASDENGVQTFTIEDEGIPFDPTLKEDSDVTLGLDDRPTGGLGIFLVKELMSSVSYEWKSGKNVLTLTL